MSKSSSRKTARKNNKRQQKHKKNRQQELSQHHSFVPSTFSGERIGAPTGAARWVGQKIASLLRFGKS
ncbi:hypothetical protein KDW_45750 [Dictyobacter vulcani]|uniref:Uncharacterized protein n=1 Tax=Dictyobacter vulcani TaxID=2607529 RepID=A0A5J4KRX3_9CHLR|nr:hypothetical protein [Dictyobacter vulcani]GER90413.1 hypothetical protein KDW_45750 [Dictyobacter vulcani]